MNELKKLAEQRINELKQVIKEKEDKLRLAPEGKIHISGTSERPFYYFVEEGKRIYVKESQRHLVKPVCQKEYDQDYQCQFLRKGLFRSADLCSGSDGGRSTETAGEFLSSPEAVQKEEWVF